MGNAASRWSTPILGPQWEHQGLKALILEDSHEKEVSVEHSRAGLERPRLSRSDGQALWVNMRAFSCKRDGDKD